MVKKELQFFRWWIGTASFLMARKEFSLYTSARRINLVWPVGMNQNNLGVAFALLVGHTIAAGPKIVLLALCARCPIPRNAQFVL